MSLRMATAKAKFTVTRAEYVWSRLPSEFVLLSKSDVLPCIVEAHSLGRCQSWVRGLLLLNWSQAVASTTDEYAESSRTLFFLKASVLSWMLQDQPTDLGDVLPDLTQLRTYLEAGDSTSKLSANAAVADGHVDG